MDRQKCIRTFVALCSFAYNFPSRVNAEPATELYSGPEQEPEEAPELKLESEPFPKDFEFFFEDSKS